MKDKQANDQQMMPKLLSLLQQNEGFRSDVYKDHLGNNTVGYGFTDPKHLAMAPMKRQIADKILQQETQTRINNLSNYYGGHIWNQLPQEAKMPLVDLEYQAGIRKGWPGLTGAIRKGDYTKATKEILNSKVNTQTPGRNFGRAASMALAGGLKGQIPGVTNGLSATNWVKQFIQKPITVASK